MTDLMADLIAVTLENANLIDRIANVLPPDANDVREHIRKASKLNLTMCEAVLKEMQKNV